MSVTSQHFSYMKALQLMADQSKRELAILMPHHGERGRICEEIIKSVLSRTLPKRFSIGTGVIISATGDVSAQTDIVIFDNFLNSPLLSEFGSCIYPVETVYATIEVKASLTKQELRKSLAAIRRIRHVGREKHYIIPGLARKNSTGEFVPASGRITVKTPPRSYIVAFEAKHLGSTYAEFGQHLCECLDEFDDHVHGVCLLDKDWFAGRMAYEKPAKLIGEEGNALMSLYLHILKGQQNFSIYPMDLGAYLNQPNTALSGADSPG